MNTGDLLSILQLIYSQGLSSQAGLAEKTGLAPSYISNVVSELRHRGLVEEAGRSPSRAGRRRVLLRVNPRLGHLIGIRAGRANTRIVVTDLAANIIRLKMIPTEIHRGERHVFDLIDRELRAILEHDRLVKGIGLALSGVIDREQGAVLFWPKVPGWSGVPVKKILQDKYSLPVVVEDTVRTMALAEQRFGVAGQFQNFVYVLVSMGVGAAIYIKGQLYLGADNLAGELGHTTIDERGELCSCGNRGCLEVYASGWAIINRAQAGLSQGVHSGLATPMGRHPERLSIEAIVAAAKARDQFAHTLLWEAGLHLGTGIASVVNLLNPEAIVLGGEVARAARSFLLRPLFHSLKTRTFHRSAQNLKVMVSRLGGEAGAAGAAVLVAQQLLPELLDARQA